MDHTSSFVLSPQSDFPTPSSRTCPLSSFASGMALPCFRKGTRRYAQLEPCSAVSRAVTDAIQTKPGLFKVATFRRWVVVLSGSELIEDVRKATDDVLSNLEPLREVCTARASCSTPHPPSWSF